MLLSIIIPLYNNESYLADCLESIRLQDLNQNDYEVIIINDGSTDSSESVAESFREKFLNFVLINQSNQGNGSARDNGLTKAKGAYIYFMDSDDYLVPNSLNKICELAAPKELDIIRFNAKKTFESFNPHEKSKTPQSKPDYKVITGLQFLAENFYGPEVWYYFVKKDLLLKHRIKFVKDHYIQDSFYTPLVYVHAKKTVDTGSDVYRYRQNIGSVTKKKSDAHIKKYNKSIVYGIERISKLRKNLPANEPYAQQCDKMLRIKQQWYCTLWIIRFARSSNNTKELNRKLQEMKSLGAFPLNDLKEGPYDNLKYRIIRIIFNSQILRYIFINVYRKYYQLTK